jgi:hypothetical protein
MNASEYLNYKKKQCPKTIARNQCIDAGLRTTILAKAANKHFVSKNQLSTLTLAMCQTSTKGFSGDYTTPVMPTLRCGPTCETLGDRYTAPFITTPGCPIPYTSSFYLSPCKVELFQGTQFDNFKVIDNYACTSNCMNKLA